jgi:hypothetical protein
VTSFFSVYQIVPIEMIVKYSKLLLFNNNGELEIKTPAVTATWCKPVEFIPPGGGGGEAPFALRESLASSLRGVV